MLSHEREIHLLRFLEALSARLRQARDVPRALRHALRATQELLDAGHGCIAVARPGKEKAEVLFTSPERSAWDTTLLARFARNEHPAIPHDLLLAPVRRRGRAWAVLALRREGRPFERGTGRMLSRIATVVSDAIESIDRERMLEVRDRIDRKIMEQLRPKDLFYQILDGLRSLTRYDHSSALLIRGDGDDAPLTLVAEQIAWTKGKSRRIGMRLPLTDEVRNIEGSGEVYGFERKGDDWGEWNGWPVTWLARLLDYNRDENDLRESAMLVAPLVARDGIFGVLKIAARHVGTFGRYDADLVERFRSQASIAIQNSQRTETLEARMLEAERKHAMAELARSVSHDVNNALGAVLPLIQQMREDLHSGRVEARVLHDDLEQVQKSLQVCRRIFGGMLSFARGGARRSGHGHVRQALDGTLAILRDSLDRHGVSLALDVPDDLPPVGVGQSDLEQVFLNLLTNARDAMSEGGDVSIRARRREGANARAAGGTVEITIGDTGCGIPAASLPMVQEPFFTTKPHGNGLGLSICRSIVWETEGRLTIESEPGRGTRVTVIVPEAANVSRGVTGASDGRER